MDDLEQFISDLRFAEIVARESERTLLVQPADEWRARSLVERFGLAGVITVKVSPYLPAGTWVLINENAIEAATRESLQDVTRWGPPRVVRGYGRF